jgi:FixJ family two-component response regulator
MFGQEIVYVLDDDAQILQSMEVLFTSAGYAVRTFSDPEVFLAAARPNVPSCLILDSHLGNMTGLELQRRLAPDSALPIIFVTGRADISIAVSAMKGGAIEFLCKPAQENELLAAVRSALHQAQQGWEARGLVREAYRSYSSLTPRERDVLPYIIRGFLNKQTAHQLGTSEITIRIHRSRIMKKMRAHTLPDLVRLAALLQIQPAGLRLGMEWGQSIRAAQGGH